MAKQFYTILTAVGKAKIANAAALGNKIELTEMALGDGGGSYYNPTEDQTSLRNEVWRGAIGNVDVDGENPNWIIIQAVVLSQHGGFMIREAGVFDDEGDLIAVGKYPETYKPAAADGSIKDLVVRMILEVSNTASVVLKVDPTVVATQQQVDAVQANLTSHMNNKNNPHNVTAKQVGAVSKSGDTMTGPLRVGGLVIRDLNCITATSPKWWKLVRIQAYDPNSGSETISFSGQVIVQSNYGRTADKQGIFTFSFGIRGISIKPVLFTAGDAAPKGNDTPRFQIWRDTDGWNYLYFQQPKYSKFCQFIYSYSGNNEYWTEEDPQQVSGLTLAWDSATDSVQDIYVGTKKVWHAGNLDPDAIKAGGVPIGAIIPWTTTTIPDGWLECNGQAVSRTGFSELFAKIGTTFGAGNGSTTFNVPDLRGEFIRGWDHGRGVDSGRAFGSGQADIFKAHNHVTDSRFNKLSARASDINNKHTPGSTDADNPTTEYRVGGIDDSMWASATMKTEGGPETRPRNVALMFIIKAKNVAGSDPAVQGANADTLDGFHASAFALSGHIHADSSTIEPAFNAALNAALNVSGDAPIYACRAWVNFDGYATPPTIRASGNVSSVTRNADGDFTVNFTTPMPHANYSATANYTNTNTAQGTQNNGQAIPWNYQENLVRIFVSGGAAEPRNGKIVSVSIHC